MIPVEDPRPPNERTANPELRRWMITFAVSGNDAALSSAQFGELLRLLSAFTYTPTQAEHAMVVLKGQVRETVVITTRPQA